MDSWLGCREYYNTVCGKCTDLLENYFRPVFKGNHGRKKILVVSIISGGIESVYLYVTKSGLDKRLNRMIGKANKET